MSGFKLNDLNLVNTASSAAAPSASQVSAKDENAQAKASVTSLPQAANKPSESLDETVQAGKQEVKEAVAKLNDYVQSIQRDLTFDFDDSTGKTVITVLDRRTKEVVRQIPDELALRLARNLQQDEPLSLFSMKV